MIITSKDFIRKGRVVWVPFGSLPIGCNFFPTLPPSKWVWVKVEPQSEDWLPRGANAVCVIRGWYLLYRTAGTTKRVFTTREEIARAQAQLQYEETLRRG